jgi:hypothetical protein
MVLLTTERHASTAPTASRCDEGAASDPASREAVLRELLDDAHARLRELRRGLQAVKDLLTF